MDQVDAFPSPQSAGWERVEQQGALPKALGLRLGSGRPPEPGVQDGQVGSDLGRRRCWGQAPPARAPCLARGPLGAGLSAVSPCWGEEWGRAGRAPPQHSGHSSGRPPGGRAAGWTSGAWVCPRAWWSLTSRAALESVQWCSDLRALASLDPGQVHSRCGHSRARDPLPGLRRLRDSCIRGWGPAGQGDRGWARPRLEAMGAGRLSWAPGGCHAMDRSLGEGQAHPACESEVPPRRTAALPTREAGPQFLDGRLACQAWRRRTGSGWNPAEDGDAAPSREGN